MKTPVRVEEGERIADGFRIIDADNKVICVDLCDDGLIYIAACVNAVEEIKEYCDINDDVVTFSHYFKAKILAILKKNGVGDAT